MIIYKGENKMDKVRTIMVEVTSQEYQKIVAGVLDISTYDTNELVSELVRRCNDKEYSTQYAYDLLHKYEVIIGSFKLNDGSSFKFELRK